MHMHSKFQSYCYVVMRLLCITPFASFQSSDNTENSDLTSEKDEEKRIVIAGFFSEEQAKELFVFHFSRSKKPEWEKSITILKMIRRNGRRFSSVLFHHILHMYMSIFPFSVMFLFFPFMFYVSYFHLCRT